MLPVEWSAQARISLAKIQFYIEERDPIAAARLRRIIEDGADRLALMPLAYRPGRVAGTREWVAHPNYIVVYRVGGESIRILNVLHARQEYP